jgi:hypothetical protein
MATAVEPRHAGLLLLPVLRNHMPGGPTGCGMVGVTVGCDVVGVIAGVWGVEPTVGRLPSAPIDQRLRQSMHGFAWRLFFPALRVATHGVALPVAVWLA